MLPSTSLLQLKAWPQSAPWPSLGLPLGSRFRSGATALGAEYAFKPAALCLFGTGHLTYHPTCCSSGVIQARCSGWFLL